MMLLRRPAVLAAWACVGLAACSNGDGGGSGTDRTGPSSVANGVAPGQSGASAPASGTAGSGVDFGNGSQMTPTVIGMKLSDGGINETTSPDDVKCGGARFTPMINRTVIPGNILLVADKSQSMMETFPATNTEKGQEARTAIANAITSLMDKVNVGAVFFPDAAGCSAADCGCNVPPFASAPPQIAFAPGPMFVPTWNSAYFPVVGGRTPLNEALQAADTGLTANLPKLTGTTVVVVVTDGEPNCVIDQMPVDQKVAALTPLPAKWLGMGVKTYVIGLPGADQPDAVTILNAVANAGGTTQHIPATDPMTVQTELSKIIGESVTSNFETCTIPLEKKPPNLDDVNLVVTMNGMELAVDRDLGDAGGWALDADAQNIVLQGRFCELAKMGEYQNITVVFGCVDVPPLPPPPPPM